MKQPVATESIEFSSKHIMASTCKILVSAILLACLSLSSGIVRRSINISNDFKKDVNYDIRHFPREKREESAEYFSKEANNSPKPEDGFLESPIIRNGRITEEEIDRIIEKKNKEEEKEDAKSDIDDITNSEDIFSYKHMYDIIQSYKLLNKLDNTDNLQLQEVENITESGTHNKLLKRDAAAAAAAAATATATAIAAAPSSLLGGNLWDTVPLEDLDTHSCGAEAFEFGHVHVSGVIVHEFFCELRKIWHYALIVFRNLKSGLSLGSLITEEIIHVSSFPGRLLHHLLRLFHAVIRQPRHLLLLPGIIHDAVPFPSVIGAIHRVGHIFFKLVHFAKELIFGHIGHILRHFFLNNHLGARLRENFLNSKLRNVQYLQGLCSVLPTEDIVTEPIVSTATTTVTSQDDTIVTPNYHKSLAEVLTSFRSAYDGYHASGISHLIRTGVKSFFSSSVITPYLSRLPFRKYFGCEPSLATGTEVNTVSSSASVSTSVASTEDSIGPIAPIAPVVPVESETVSSSASVSTTTITETQPVIPSAPLISSYTPMIEPIPIVPPATNTVESTVATSSSSATVTTPEIAAASSASASASSTLNVAPTPIISPLTLPRYNRPILPIIAPTATSASSAAASAGIAGAASAASAASSAHAVSPYLNGFNLVFPREKIINALGYDCLLPGDIVTVTLRNRSTLFGHVLDTTSPIIFNFLRPKLHAAVIRKARRVWHLLPRDFRDPTCIQTLNNPLLLRHVF